MMEDMVMHTVQLSTHPKKGGAQSTAMCAGDSCSPQNKDRRPRFVQQSLTLPALILNGEVPPLRWKRIQKMYVVNTPQYPVAAPAATIAKLPGAQLIDMAGLPVEKKQAAATAWLRRMHHDPRQYTVLYANIDGTDVPYRRSHHDNSQMTPVFYDAIDGILFQVGPSLERRLTQTAYCQKLIKQCSKKEDSECW